MAEVQKRVDQTEVNSMWACSMLWDGSVSHRFQMMLQMTDPLGTVAGPSGRAVEDVGLRPFTCWDRGFESRRGHGRLSVVSVVCCQVEVSATSWPLVQGSPTDCGASLSVKFETS